MSDYYLRFLELVDEIERDYPVTRWQVGDVPVWPLARDALYVDLYWQAYQRDRVDAHAARQHGLGSRIRGVVSQAATPLTNVWRGRHDFRHLLFYPRSANVLFFGEESSLERTNGVWRSRFFDPLIQELHRMGRSTFVMQRGDSWLLPRSTPVFYANTIEKWSHLFAASAGLSERLASTLPEHDAVIKFLDRNCAPSGGLDPALLRKKAAVVTARAYGYERVLEVVRPSICVMMTTGGVGYGLVLACRRRGVLSVEVQRSGMGPRLLEYCWSALPENGYAILPAVFWTWTESEVAAIENWSKTLKLPWHRGIHGGNPQLQAWLDNRNPDADLVDAQIKDLRERYPANLEILVALQNHDGYIDLWNDLAGLIERGSPQWRWWLRRHPHAPTATKELGRLLMIRRPNVLIDEASSLPLPALLRHMDAFISIRSGASGEASMFGLTPFFLSPLARDLFPQLFESGEAEIIDISALEQRLHNRRRTSATRFKQRDLRTVFAELDLAAAEYSVLCRNLV